MSLYPLTLYEDSRGHPTPSLGTLPQPAGEWDSSGEILNLTVFWKTTLPRFPLTSAFLDVASYY